MTIPGAVFRVVGQTMKALMRQLLVFLLAVFAITAASAAPRAEHVFIISIDGGKPAVIAQSHMPVLQQLVAEGAHTWVADTTYPSITLPSHTSMLTGVGPGVHKVLWNEWIPSNGLVTVPTIFVIAKQAGLSTAMFVGKEKFRHLDLPGSLDVFEFNPANSTNVTKTMAGDLKPMKEDTVLAKYVAQDAARYIRDKKPNLCFIHFTDTDNTGHKYGWGSPEQIQAFADVDVALGVVVQAVRDAGIADSSVIIVSADHGGHAKTHGLSIPDDMLIPWIAWGAGVKKNFEITAPVVTYDTAATALWLLDLPRSDSLEGKPVTSAFEP
jgi:predicted AlkP superfamily pyrophosphatase or phosphodiesterase